MTSIRQHPRFRGITTFHDPHGRFRFRYSSDWQRNNLTDQRDGVMVSPEASDPATYVSAWISPLDLSVVAEDLDTLTEGVEAGLRTLPDCHLEDSSETVLGNLVKLQRVYTFRQQGRRRKRRAWTLYVDSWQIVLIFQGANTEAYQHWLAMANYTFATFNIAEDLWFATDRDLAAN